MRRQAGAQPPERSFATMRKAVPLALVMVLS